MMLDGKEAKEFVRLHQSLLAHASKRLGTKPRVDSASGLRELTVEERAKIRDALMSHPELIDSFPLKSTWSLIPVSTLKVSTPSLKAYGPTAGFK